MWFEDLTECSYLGEEYAKLLTAIGWLEKGKDFTKGNTPKEIIEKIYEFSKTSEMYIRFRGYHRCEFCDYVNVEFGATTILIAYENKIYICPALIAHYMEVHSYLPPNEFIKAVLNYDHQFAMEKFEKIRENKFK